MKRCFLLSLTVLLILSGGMAHAETYALLIGLGDYQDKALGKMQALTAGVNGLEKALIKNGVPAANIELLTHETKIKPTRDAIRAALKRLSERVKSGDTVWVMYAGHGNERQGVGYLSCYDSKPRTSDEAPSSGLSIREFTAPLSTMPASLLLVGFEACRDESEAGNADENLPQAVRQVDFNLVAPEGKPGPKRVVALFSSSTGRSSTILADQSLGVFSSCLIRGASGEAADSQGTIRVRNLRDYLNKAVPGTAYREVGMSQMPECLAFGEGVSDVVLSQGHAPQSGGASAVPLKIGTTPEEKWVAEFQKGYELRAANKPDEALNHFREAAKAKPNDEMAQLTVGIQFYDLQRWADAEPYFTKAIKATEPRAASFLYLGLVRQEQNKYDDAEPLFQQAVKRSKGWYVPSYLYGLFLLNCRHDFKQGEKLVRQAIKLNPNVPPMKIALARTLLQSGLRNPDEIEKLISDAMKLDQRNHEGWLALGQLQFYVKKDLKEAKKSLLRCLDSEPGNYEAMSDLAKLSYSEQDYDQTVVWCDKLLALQPKAGYFYIIKATALYQLSRMDESKAAARKAIELGAYSKDAEIFELLNIKPDAKNDDKKKP